MPSNVPVGSQMLYVFDRVVHASDLRKLLRLDQHAEGRTKQDRVQNVQPALRRDCIFREARIIYI